MFNSISTANVTPNQTVNSTWATDPVSKAKTEAEYMRDIYGSAGTANVTPNQTVNSTGATAPVGKAKTEAEYMAAIYASPGPAPMPSAQSSGGGGFLSGLFKFFMPFMQLVMNTLSMTNPFAGFVDAIIKATNKKA